MELHFHEPQIRWSAHRSAGEVLDESVGASDAYVTVSYPVFDRDTRTITRINAARLPCTSTTKFDDEHELLDQPVEFQLVAESTAIAAHVIKFSDCLPILTKSAVEWSAPITMTKKITTVSVKIPVTTNRRPREAIANALQYRDRALSLARKLALHKNAVAIGLLPPIVGCFLGVIVTAPLWVPITLAVGILGFPLWLVLGVGVSLVIAISAISSVITIKLVQSKRLKSSVRELAQSPSGQFLLFSDAGNKRMLSPSEASDKLKAYINEDPSRKLVASLMIDFIGNATFVLPGIGELADLFWAPASASFIASMYSESVPSAKYFAFIEEVLPFTDVIPTATLAWMKENIGSGEIRKLVAKIRTPKRS